MKLRKPARWLEPPSELFGTPVTGQPYNQDQHNHFQSPVLMVKSSFSIVLYIIHLFHSYINPIFLMVLVSPISPIVHGKSSSSYLKLLMPGLLCMLRSLLVQFDAGIQRHIAHQGLLSDPQRHRATARTGGCRPNAAREPLDMLIPWAKRQRNWHQKKHAWSIWSLLFFASHFTCPTAQHQCQHKYFWLTNAKMMHAVARFMVCRSRCKLFTSSNLLGSFGRSCANHVEALDLFRHGPVRLVRYVRCWLLPQDGCSKSDIWHQPSRRWKR